MFKKYQSLILIILLAVAVWLVLTSRGSSNPPDLGTTTPILFYSTTCPHCKNVEEYLIKNKVRAKIKIEELEVSQAPNAEKYQQAINICQAPSDQTGSVPFLYAEGKCYFGDVDVISYFKNRIK